MTRKEKKYAALYLEYYNRYGLNIPDSEYDKLSQLRRQLGIRLQRAQEIDREIVAETAGGSTVPLRKTDITADTAGLPPLSALPFPLGGAAGESSPYQQLLAEVAQYETAVNNILGEVAGVSSQMDSIKEQLVGVSGSLIKEGMRLMKKKHRRSGKSKTGLVLSGAGVALGLGAYVFQSYRRRIMEQKHQEQMEKLQAKKREIADIRLQTIEQLHASFKENIAQRMGTLYEKEFHEEVTLDDPLRQQKTESFKRDFVLTIKARYLDAILDYIVAEMKAWKAGQQSSGRVRPDINQMVDAELMTWPAKLDMTRNDGADWDDMMATLIRFPRQSYPYPIYLMLSDPYMLRNYVGLDIQNTANVTEPLLRISYNEATGTIDRQDAAQQPICEPVQQILQENGYYNDCAEMLDTYHVPEPKGFARKDAIIMAIYIGVLLLLAVLIWQTDGLLFWLLSIIYCLSVPFTVLPVTENLPYVKEEIQHEEMLERLKRREAAIARKYSTSLAPSSTSAPSAPKAP